MESEDGQQLGEDGNAGLWESEIASMTGKHTSGKLHRCPTRDVI